MLEICSLKVTLPSDQGHEKTLLGPLSFCAQKGEVIAIRGSNGAGKSTLFKAINGLIPSFSGEILLDGCPLNPQTSAHKALVSQVMQDPRLGTLAGLTLQENLSFALRRGEKRGLKLANRTQERAFFQQHLAPLNMGLEDRLDQKVDTLSGGQRQALSLVMATLKMPKILLLDEITAALDPRASENVLSLMNNLVQNSSVITLMITHHANEAEQYGNKTLWLEKGHIASLK